MGDKVLNIHGDTIFEGTPEEINEWGKNAFNRVRALGVRTEPQLLSADMYFKALGAVARGRFMTDDDGVVKRHLKAHFSTFDNYLGTEELMEFWEALTGEEKQYYRQCVADGEI